VRATEVRLVSAQRSATARASELRKAIAHTERIATDLRDVNGRVRVLAESNRRLRRELRAARRARRHTRRQP
jgi:outer membrane murein-binding lipoprotein Lpp